MKKFFVLLALVAVLAAVLCGCNTKFTCDNCKEEKTGEKHEVTFFGEETWCDDCWEEMRSALEVMSGSK